MNIASLFATLGYKIDDKGLKKFELSLRTAGKSMAIVSAAVGAGIYSLNKFVDNTLQNTIAMENFNTQTGLSVKKLQEWQRAAQLSNLSISAEEVSSSIAGLQRQIVELHQGRGNAEPFNNLNIQVGGTGKDALEILEEVRASIVNLDNATATNVIAKMGINPQMINVLRLSNQEFAELSKARFLTKAQRDDIMSLGKSFKALKMEMQSLKDQAVAKISPFLKDIIKNFFLWLRNNGDKVVNIMSQIAETVGRFLQGIGRAIVFLAKLIENITGVTNGFKILTTIIGGVMLYAFSPFIAMITAILLLLDDIAVWKMGGDSLFGGLYDSLSGLQPIFGAILDGFKIMGQGVMFLVEQLSKLAEYLGVLQVIKDTIMLGAKVFGAAAIGTMVAGPVGGAIAGGGVLLGEGVNLINKQLDRSNSTAPINTSNNTANNTVHNYDITMNGVNNPQDFFQQIQNVNQQSKLSVR